MGAHSVSKVLRWAARFRGWIPSGNAKRKAGEGARRPTTAGARCVPKPTGAGIRAGIRAWRRRRPLSLCSHEIRAMSVQLVVAPSDWRVARVALCTAPAWAIQSPRWPETRVAACCTAARRANVPQDSLFGMEARSLLSPQAPRAAAPSPRPAPNCALSRSISLSMSSCSGASSSLFGIRLNSYTKYM